MTEEQIKTLAENLCRNNGGDWEDYKEEWTRATHCAVECLNAGTDPTELGEAMFTKFHSFGYDGRSNERPIWSKQSKTGAEEWTGYAAFITTTYLLTPRKT